jgi:hypothetical protein
MKFPVAVRRGKTIAGAVGVVTAIVCIGAYHSASFFKYGPMPTIVHLGLISVGVMCIVIGVRFGYSLTVRESTMIKVRYGILWCLTMAAFFAALRYLDC